MNSTPSGITRGRILKPLLKKYGKAGYSITNIWAAFYPNQNIDYDPNKCYRLKNIKLSVMKKWKKADSYNRFIERYDSWLKEEFSCTEIPECLLYKKKVKNLIMIIFHF